MNIKAIKEILNTVIIGLDEGPLVGLAELKRELYDCMTAFRAIYQNVNTFDEEISEALTESVSGQRINIGITVNDYESESLRLDLEDHVDFDNADTTEQRQEFRDRIDIRPLVKMINRFRDQKTMAYSFDESNWFDNDTNFWRLRQEFIEGEVDKSNLLPEFNPQD